jgi:hypothetical protein
MVEFFTSIRVLVARLSCTSEVFVFLIFEVLVPSLEEILEIIEEVHV